jgi:hypothetical protein
VAEVTLQDLLKGRSASARRLITDEYNKNPQQAIEDFGTKTSTSAATGGEPKPGDYASAGDYVNAVAAQKKNMTESARRAAADTWNQWKELNPNPGAAAAAVPGEQDYNSPTNPGGTFNPPPAGATPAPAPVATTKKTGATTTTTSGAAAGAAAGSSAGGKTTTKKAAPAAKSETTTLPATIPTTATGVAGPFDPNDPAWKAFTTKFGVPAAFIQSDSTGELQTLFENAMKGHLTQGPTGTFAQAFLATNFAKTHSNQWQAAEKDRTESPISYADSYNRVSDYLTSLMGQMGYSVDSSLMGANYDPNNPTASHIDASTTRTYDPNNLVEWTLHNYYGQSLTSPDIANQIRQHIVQLSQNNPNQTLGGDKATNVNQLRSWAKDYGLNSLVLPSGAAGADYATNAADSIEKGNSTLDTWKTDMMTQAANIYKPFAKQIMDGATVSSLAAPYTNVLSNLLENVDPSSVDLSSPTGYGAMVSKALQGTDPANPAAMSLDQFATQVKQRPEWLNTQNARNGMMDTANQLLHSFGLVVD